MVTQSVVRMPDNLGESVYIILYRLILGPISILGNGLILYIALKNRKFCSTFCNCLITLLALSEVITGFGLNIRAFFSMYIISLNTDSYDRFTCIVFALPHMFGISFGQIILLAIAVDRFLAVSQPMAYIKASFKKELIMAISSAIFVSTFFCWFSQFRLDPSPVKQCSTGASVTTFFAYFWSVVGVAIAMSILGFYIATVYKLRTRKKFSDRTIGMVVQRQKRVFVTISLILLSYAIFWCVPLLVMIFVVYANITFMIGYTSTIIGLCSGVHSVLVFFIYILKHKDLRKYFKKTLPSLVMCKSTRKKCTAPLKVSSYVLEASDRKITAETSVNGNMEDEILL